MKKQKGFIVPAMIIIVLILTIGGGAYVYLESKKVNNIKEDVIVEENVLTTSSEKTDIVPTTASTTSTVGTNEIKSQASINTDKDIQMVSDIMQKYKIAYEAGDEDTIKSFYSKATLDFFNQFGTGASLVKGLKITIGKISYSGKNIRVGITETNSNGSKEEMDYVFIQENAKWKMDIGASFASEVQKSNVSQGDVNGHVDLVVTGIKIYPSHPIVNSEDVEIAVTIKNIGTKSSEKGAPAVAEILENTAYTPVQGGSLAPLGAGESVTWKYSMYGQNEFFKRSDVAGKKTVKVELNGYKDVVEKNYNNNSFTYNFDVFDK